MSNYKRESERFPRFEADTDDDSLSMEGGTGIVVTLYTSPEDGAPVVQIDTPMDSDLHETIRVWLNDAQVQHRAHVWTGAPPHGWACPENPYYQPRR